MGSNMQRQAVPLLVTDPPLVATGLEVEAARNSSMIVRAKNKGTVTYCDARQIEVGGDKYELRKFVGLNERTCQNQKPIVNVGDKVEKGSGPCGRAPRDLSGRIGPRPQRVGGLHGLGTASTLKTPSSSAKTW